MPWPWSPKKTEEKKLEVGVRQGRVGKKESGQLRSQTFYKDKIPHPLIMDKLDDLNKDPEIETAITTLTGMTVGVGFYTEMGEEVEGKQHPNKKKVDDYAEKVNLDEILVTITRQRFEKGFCPVAIQPDNSLKVLPAETFFVWRKATGDVFKYTQEVNQSVVETWNKSELDDILLFVHKETPLNPYGKAMAECIEDQIEARQQMTKDAPAVLHKLGYPLRWWDADTKEIMDKVFKVATERNPDEDMFFDNVQKDQLRMHTESMDSRLNFSPYVTELDEMVAEGLFAPLMIYLRNATEASSKTILEAIDRSVQADQRYFKRRIEKYVFGRICGEPIPRLVFGSPKTGIEDITFADITSAVSTKLLTWEQGQDLLKKMGVPLLDVQKPEVPLPQNVPFNLSPEKSANLQSGLNVIQQNYEEKQISLTEALIEARRVIDGQIEATKADVRRKLCEELGQKTVLSAESESIFHILEIELFNNFRNRLIPTGVHGHGDGKPRAFRVEPQY